MGLAPILKLAVLSISAGSEDRHVSQGARAGGPRDDGRALLDEKPQALPDGLAVVHADQLQPRIVADAATRDRAVAMTDMV
jgi:hypothetical protein